MLWLLLTKECHLTGPKRKLFSAAVPTLRNTIPSEIDEDDETKCTGTD